LKKIPGQKAILSQSKRGEPAAHFDLYRSAGQRGQHDDGGDQLAQRSYRLAIVA